MEVERSFVGLERITAAAEEIRSRRTGTLRIAALPGARRVERAACRSTKHSLPAFAGGENAITVASGARSYNAGSSNHASSTCRRAKLRYGHNNKKFQGADKWQSI
jgi:hypothetical protein